MNIEVREYEIYVTRRFFVTECVEVTSDSEAGAIDTANEIMDSLVEDDEQLLKHLEAGDGEIEIYSEKVIDDGCKSRRVEKVWSFKPLNIINL